VAGICIFTVVVKYKYKFVKLNFRINYFFKECISDFSLTSLSNNRNVTCVCCIAQMFNQNLS
jgi:hypothetical protein